MGKWQRSLYQPVLPLGKDGKRVTGSAEHIALSRKAAGEGMVLVKNENDTLPLAKGTKVALFGKGTIDYVKGGGGSGDVTVEYIRNFYEGMKIKEAEGEVSLFHELPEFYEKNVKEQYAAGAVPGMTREPEVPDELVQKAKAYTDTAIITICRFSGEGWDRKCQINDEGYELFEDEKKQIELSASIFENGDFCLTNGEAAMVEKVKANFKNVIVVMNVGGMVDTSWFKDCKEIPAVLMAWQGGMEGGLAAADVVTGDVNPSGKLVDTYAATLEDYPSTENFHKSVYYVDYNEDIYVGYRYFETIPGAAEKVNYPFGFGLSYTSFETEVLGAEEKDGKIVVKAAVTNTGKRAGKEVDTSWFKDCKEIPAVLMAWQGGMEGGLAAADVVTGDVNPSGKLVDTYAATLEDYPSTENFHKSVYYVDYNEDIYVGYRYFETIPGAAEKVNYPFGFGLSYTSFETEVLGAEEKDGKIVVKAAVTNTGKRAGKEVVQLYYGAPQGKLGKPAKELGAYRKTRLLQPGETQRVVLSFTVEDMASFDDLGKVAKSAYVLEAGSYVFYVGNNVRDAKKLDFTYDLAEAKVTAQYTSLAAPHKLEKRLLADGTYEALPTDNGPVEEEGLERQDKLTLEGFLPAVKAQERKSFGELMEAAKTNPNLMNVVEGKETLDEFVDKLPTEALIHLLGGQPNTGVANTFGMGNLPEYGIPNIMTADGPAGLRIQPQCGVNTTAWPCATLLACTWDPELIEEIGKAGGEEVKENNIGIWLTPAVNIHRSPLCGRNFEYYSEDPLVAGKSGAAMVRGMQSEHIGASVKHFCCNNKETNRKDSDSRVSERALREIYLKAFEIIVKEADPYTIMSSYNLINGVQASENKDLLTGILRGEWDFKGMVTTDWWTHGEHYRETKAGNDIKMANGYEERVQEAFEKGYITRDEIALCAKRILTMILRMD